MVIPELLQLLPLDTKPVSLLPVLLRDAVFVFVNETSKLLPLLLHVAFCKKNGNESHTH